jgi:hypothetical protein
VLQSVFATERLLLIRGWLIAVYLNGKEVSAFNTEVLNKRIFPIKGSLCNCVMGE